MGGQKIVAPRSPDLALYAAAGLVAAAACGCASMWAVVCASCWTAGRPAPGFDLRAASRSWWWPSDVDALWGTSAGSGWPDVVVRVVAGVLCLAVLAVLARLLARAAAWAEDSTDDLTGKVPGTASAAQIRQAAGEKAVLRRAGSLRPSLDSPKITDCAYRLGTASGVAAFATVEDSTLIVGPPRSGKGLHLIVNQILDAPGAVVTTSTRPDNLTLTLTARQRVGPVVVFDPQGLTPGLTGPVFDGDGEPLTDEAGRPVLEPLNVKWSPIRGCERPKTAQIRAKGFASGSGIGGGGVSDGSFWEAQSQTVIQCLLHAAALGGKDAADLYRWSVNPVAAVREARPILTDDPRAAEGWASTLAAVADGDPRQRDSVWMGVRSAFAALSSPETLEAVRPRSKDEEFDPVEFVRDRGTLYLLASWKESEIVGPLVAAMVEDVIEAAERLAAGSQGARLDPPVAFVLDEIANFAALPSLLPMMSQGGGSGMTTVAVVQSKAQLRDKWGKDAGDAIWDSSIVKVILGGGSNTPDLKEWSDLIGERDETQIRVSHGTGLLGSLDRSESFDLRKTPILSVAQLRELPFGTAVLLLRSAPAIMLDLKAWNERADAGRLKADRKSVEKQIRDSLASGRF
ncbi:MAG: TraM recognition domain-containing protein [Aeromicrobium sp.]|uniref:type IV secretory system conjugative DNA transfer family protein n=1 Tax=Aeromicrobium sp. TaxID=1871063 RepID=UPI0039E44954